MPKKLENASTSTATKSSFPVKVNGCTGNMGRAVAEAALSASLQFVPLSLTSPHLGHHDGHLVSQIHGEALNALYSLCKINKRRQEQAAENGIIPHLMHFIVTDSHLKKTALPLLCDMAHASRYTREQLRVHNGLDVYLSLLDDEVWAVTALDSLAVCLAHDNDHRKVEQALLKKEAVQFCWSLSLSVAVNNLLSIYLSHSLR